jgi:hypothetical protein
MQNYLRLIPLFLLATACSSNDITIEGHVIDGYIANATVFIDTNNNGLQDSSELSTTTDNSGRYRFNLTSEGYGKIVVACFDSSSADTDNDSVLATDVDFCMSSVDITNYTNQAVVHISPFTHLTQMQINSGLSYTEAKDNITASLTDLTTTVAVTDDYVAKERFAQNRPLSNLARLMGKYLQNTAKDIRENSLQQNLSEITANTSSQTKFQQLYRYKSLTASKQLGDYATKIKLNGKVALSTEQVDTFLNDVYTSDISNNVFVQVAGDSSCGIRQFLLMKAVLYGNSKNINYPYRGDILSYWKAIGQWQQTISDLPPAFKTAFPTQFTLAALSIDNGPNTLPSSIIKYLNTAQDFNNHFVLKNYYVDKAHLVSSLALSNFDEVFVNGELARLADYAGAAKKQTYTAANPITNVITDSNSYYIIVVNKGAHWVGVTTEYLYNSLEAKPIALDTNQKDAFIDLNNLLQNSGLILEFALADTPA